MSEMELNVAIRFTLEPLDTKNIVSELTKIFGKAPNELEEYDGVVEYFRYDYKKNDGFAVHVIGEEIFADYILKEGNEEYDINLDITDNDIKRIISLANEKGLKYSSYKIKVLYFYNGGCAGLAEIK